MRLNKFHGRELLDKGFRIMKKKAKTQPMTFVMNNGRSIKAQKRNKADMENSQLGYYIFMVRLLRERNGIIWTSDLEDAVKRNYGPSFGPADLRLKKVGRNGWMPKWKNTLDFAKKMATDLDVTWWRLDDDGEKV